MTNTAENITGDFLDRFSDEALAHAANNPSALLALAKEFADQTAPVSVAMIRQMIWRMAGAEHPMEAHQLDSRAMKSRGGSADVREGVESFLQKRAAVFPDKVSEDLPDFFDWQGEPPFE